MPSNSGWGESRYSGHDGRGNWCCGRGPGTKTFTFIWPWCTAHVLPGWWRFPCDVRSSLTLSNTHTPIKKKKPRYFPPCTLTVWPQTANNPITTSFITFQSYRVWIEVWVQYHELFLFHYQKCIHKCTPFYTICYVLCYLKLVVLFSSIKKSI